MPQTLLEALELIRQPEQLEVKPVTALVERDPAVAARLLQTVNSAYYGLRRTISSVERAVVLLSPVAVAGIVVGMNMLKLRSVLSGPASTCFTSLIQHSAATAFLARHLLERSPQKLRSHLNLSRARIGDSYTGSLLHDFGKIILVYNFPEKAVALYENHAREPQPHGTDLCLVEGQIFGYDHTEVGAFASRKLNFPDTLFTMIHFHHQPAKARCDDETALLLATTAAANLAAKTMGYALTGPIAWATCLHHPTWQYFAACQDLNHEHLAAIVSDLQAQEEHLNHYIQQMFEAVDLHEPATHPYEWYRAGPSCDRLADDR